MTSNSRIQAAERTLGDLIHESRMARGFTFKALAEASGVAQGQIHKLEKNQVKKANPAHLAALAEPLGLTIFSLYSAAGYKTPAALSHLGAELEAKLSRLQPDALVRLNRYVEQVLREQDLEGSAYELDKATN